LFTQLKEKEMMVVVERKTAEKEQETNESPVTPKNVVTPRSKSKSHIRSCSDNKYPDLSTASRFGTGEKLKKQDSKSPKKAICSDFNKLLIEIENAGVPISPSTAEKFKPLLPPPKSNRSYTLVLDLDETLVHFEQKSDESGEFFLRPHVKTFLKAVSKKFEIVIFTAALQAYADYIVDYLDPEGLVSHRLYRDHTSFKDQVYLKVIIHLAFRTSEGSEEILQKLSSWTTTRRTSSSSQKTVSTSNLGSMTLQMKLC